MMEDVLELRIVKSIKTLGIMTLLIRKAKNLKSRENSIFIAKFNFKSV